MTPEEWARSYVYPPSFTACGHPLVDRSPLGVTRCRMCGHHWTEHTIELSDEYYNATLAYMAFRLDSK